MGVWWSFGSRFNIANQTVIKRMSSLFVAQRVRAQSNVPQRWECKVSGVCVHVCSWNHDSKVVSQAATICYQGSEASWLDGKCHDCLCRECVHVCETVPLTPWLAGRLWRTVTFDTSQTTSVDFFEVIIKDVFQWPNSNLCTGTKSLFSRLKWDFRFVEERLCKVVVRRYNIQPIHTVPTDYSTSLHGIRRHEKHRFNMFSWRKQASNNANRQQE